jgi:crotonobetainyl-CoA:carnitine CoA-transferase CaiB-like acyl-CoA transferase
VQVVREHQLARLAELVGHHEWIDDERFADRARWFDLTDDLVRPAVEKWSANMTRMEACELLSAAGIASGPCFRESEVVVDPHEVSHDMVVEFDRPEGVEQPVLVPGNPIKLSKMAEGPEARTPWLGEHTDDLLRDELGLDNASIAALHEEGAIS